MLHVRGKAHTSILIDLGKPPGARWLLAWYKAVANLSPGLIHRTERQVSSGNTLWFRHARTPESTDMSAFSQVNDLQSLLQRAAKTRVDCRSICGSKATILYSATNLYGILRRLQQEASMARSSLNKSTPPSEENLALFCARSGKLLSDISDFLLALKTMGYYEDKILGSREFASFPERQNMILDHFDAEIMHLTYTASRILITASAETLGELREQLDYGTGSPLSPVLNDLTARLMANGDLRLSMLVKGPGNEQILWEALEHELLSMSMDKAFLHKHKKVVLRYVRALERRSGFSCSPNAIPSDGASTSGKPQNMSAKRRSLGGEDAIGGKRARVSGELLDVDAKEPDAQASKARQGGIPFRFRDPRITYGPEVDDDLLVDFLEEEEDPQSQGKNLRQRMRDTYRVLCDDYEPRYELTIFLETGHDKRDEKEIVGIIHEIEKTVVMELDNLELGQDTDLRNLRKMIINKAQKMLDDLEKIKMK